MADQQLTLGAASGLMMIRTGRSEEEEMTTVFIRVPDPTLVATYRGFEKVDEHDLPQEAVLLYGDLSEFQKFFRKPPPQPLVDFMTVRKLQHGNPSSKDECKESTAIHATPNSRHGPVVRAYSL